MGSTILCARLKKKKGESYDDSECKNLIEEKWFNIREFFENV